MNNELLSVEQAATYLGVRVGTIYSWAYQRKLPYYKVGRLLKFKQSELETWITEKKVNSIHYESPDYLRSV